MFARSRLIGTVLVALTIGALIMSSCASSPSNPASVTAPSDNKPYGSLVVSAGFGTGAIDPLLSSSDTFMGIGQAIFDTLLNYDANDVLGAGIAERWDVAPDGMSHTYYIRKGVKFHDGSDLTAADVKFSMDRMLAPDSVAQTYAALYRGALASVDVKDDYTVIFRFKAPQFEPLTYMDSGMTAVMPKKYIQEKGVDYFQKHPIGSGPWKLTSFELGNRMDLEAVENHWRATPKFKNVTLLNVKEESTAVAMVKTGELDMAMVGSDAAAS
ncbi:MAG: ABC transporter substrate-binding protein, partial [Dehalococcoidia bacterium]|nr:ABC transporter substrate-binding protein [Dehalococcoidia bacterium]